MSISDNDVKVALNAMREAMTTLARAIEAQSAQVRELAEENQRLHDTVKNRDETISWMRDKAELATGQIANQYAAIASFRAEVDKLKAELAKSTRDCDEFLKANLEASDEIRGLRQLILEITLTTAKAAEVGAKRAEPSNVTPLPAQFPHPADPAATFAG